MTAMYKTISFSRQELFDRVWAAPMLQIAKDIGISDVALGKACRRARIPVPGRGYWAKPVNSRSKPELPSNSNPYYEVVQFNVLDPRFRVPTVKSDVATELVPVPDRLVDPHPLVARTLKLASRADSVNGRLMLDFKQALHISVSGIVLDRALRILDALIKASERSGFSWRVTNEGRTVVTLQDVQMKVVLKERLSRREVPRPTAQIGRSRRGWEHEFSPMAWPRHEWVSTNQLSFQIDEYVEGVMRRNWNDTNKAALDDRLHEIVAGLPVVISGIAAHRKSVEDWRRAYKLEEELRLEQVRESERLRRLRASLVRSMSNWERAGRIRKFCDAVELKAATLLGDQYHSISCWLNWARDQADALDPLEASIDRLISMDVDLPSSFDGRSSYDRPSPGWWNSQNQEADG